MAEVLETMDVAEAKRVWNDDAVLRVQVQPCTCGWRENECVLKTTQPECLSLAALLNVQDQCNLMPKFRQMPARCPKTGCDDGGTLGGWCARVRPDGTRHCRHKWCHRVVNHVGALAPCVTTTHTCIVTWTQTKDQPHETNNQPNETKNQPHETKDQPDQTTDQSHETTATPVDFQQQQLRIQQLEMTLRELQTRTLCVVCHDRPISCLLRPCMHANICKTCADAIWSGAPPARACPVCRRAIDSIEHPVYLP